MSAKKRKIEMWTRFARGLRNAPGALDFLLFPTHFSTIVLNLGLYTSDRTSSNHCKRPQGGSVFSKIF